MANLFTLVRGIFPDQVYGNFENYSFQKASTTQIVGIEDFIFRNSGEKLQLPQDELSILIIPDQNATISSIDDLVVIVEFSLSLLAIDGHPNIVGAGIFTDGKYSLVKLISYELDETPCKFSGEMNGTAILQWIKRCFSSYKKIKNRLHVTSHRYSKYSRKKRDLDALLDLCISLESLSTSQS